jgi:hypothetical protein
MPQSDIRIALRTLDFEKRFPTDPWKINNLTLTVDQEVGGSNPPSCTNDLADPVSNSDSDSIFPFVSVASFAGRRGLLGVVFPQSVELAGKSWNGPSNRGLLSPKL